MDRMMKLLSNRFVVSLGSVKSFEIDVRKLEQSPDIKEKPFIREDFALKILTCFEVLESFRTVIDIPL